MSAPAHDHGHGGHEAEDTRGAEPRDFRERTYLPAILKGLAITSRHFVRNLFGERDPNPQGVNRTGTSLPTTAQNP